jgi:hypothetical protein
MFSLQPPRHISTLPTASVGPSWHVGFTPDSGRIAARQRTDASGLADQTCRPATLLQAFASKSTNETDEGRE